MLKRSASILALAWALSGCVGFAVSLPSEKSSTRAASSNAAVDQDFFPRELGVNERVDRDKEYATITYSRKLGGCYHHILLVPIFPDGCRGFETWDYSLPGEVTTTLKSYRIYGFWCSLLPRLAWLPALAAGIDIQPIPFCQFRWGTELHPKDESF